jgi:hypothetical protein
MQKETFKEWHSNSTYGICRLSLLSVFRQPIIGSGLSTQLLFGELYEIMSSSPDTNWLEINGLGETGTGWILASQHHALTKEEFDFFVQSPLQVVTKGVGKIQLKASTLFLLPGSQIHAGHHEIFEWEESIKFDGESRAFEKKAGREELRSIALDFLNVPYLPGGRSLFGLNESSWLNLVFKIAGYIFPNHLPSVLSTGKDRPAEEIQTGDIVVFGNSKGIPFQAGLSMGESEILWVREKVKFGVFDPQKWHKRSGKNAEIQLLHVKNLLD